MGPRTKALEKVNEIKNLCKSRTWPKHALGTLKLGFQDLNTSIVHILSFSDMGSILTMIDGKKMENFIHSIKPHYSKPLFSKK